MCRFVGKVISIRASAHAAKWWGCEVASIEGRCSLRTSVFIALVEEIKNEQQDADRNRPKLLSEHHWNLQ